MSESRIQFSPYIEGLFFAKRNQRGKKSFSTGRRSLQTRHEESEKIDNEIINESYLRIAVRFSHEPIFAVVVPCISSLVLLLLSL